MVPVCLTSPISSLAFFSALLPQIQQQGNIKRLSEIQILKSDDSNSIRAHVRFHGDVTREQGCRRLIGRKNWPSQVATAMHIRNGTTWLSQGKFSRPMSERKEQAQHYPHTFSPTEKVGANFDVQPNSGMGTMFSAAHAWQTRPTEP